MSGVRNSLCLVGNTLLLVIHPNPLSQSAMGSLMREELGGGVNRTNWRRNATDCASGGAVNQQQGNIPVLVRIAQPPCNIN